MRRTWAGWLAKGTVLGVLGCGLLSLAGCSTPIPDVTFYSSGHSAAAPPLQYCDATLRSCLSHANPPVFLSVTPGNPVQVSVPVEFTKTPWQVAARYQDSHGKEFVACSTIFANGTRLAYTVTPPPGYRLVLIEVYQVSAVIGITAQQQVFFQNSGVWSMVASPPAGQQPELPKPGDNLCQSTA